MMIAIVRFLGLGLLGCTLLMQQAATAQQAVPHQRARALTPAMQYFGRGLRTPIDQQPSAAHHQAPPTERYQPAGGKPFQNMALPPTISPYLSLDAVESSVGLPNYYSRVLPQIKQQEANQTQAAELRRLQQQLRLANAPGVISSNRNGGVPITGRSSQFMNNGGFFPTAQR